jgi:hypothetical protein
MSHLSSMCPICQVSWPLKSLPKLTVILAIMKAALLLYERSEIIGHARCA